MKGGDKKVLAVVCTHSSESGQCAARAEVRYSTYQGTVPSTCCQRVCQAFGLWCVKVFAVSSLIVLHGHVRADSMHTVPLTNGMHAVTGYVPMTSVLELGRFMLARIDTAVVNGSIHALFGSCVCTMSR